VTGTDEAAAEEEEEFFFVLLCAAGMKRYQRTHVEDRWPLLDGNAAAERGLKLFEVRRSVQCAARCAEWSLSCTQLHSVALS